MSDNNQLFNNGRQEEETTVMNNNEDSNSARALLKSLSQRSLNPNKFGHLLKHLCELYSELNWLADGARCKDVPNQNATTFSQVVLMTDEKTVYPEFEKTVLSIFCILWALHKGDEAHKEFISVQLPPVTPLSEDSWRVLQNYIEEIFTSDDAKAASAEQFIAQEAALKSNVKSSFALKKNFSTESYDLTDLNIDRSPDLITDKSRNDAAEALIVYSILADLGRVEYVRKKVREEGIEEVDTHKIVLMALESNPTLFPSYQRLGEKYQGWIREGLKADFNFAQMIQAELVPGKLPGLKVEYLRYNSDSVKGISSMALDLFSLQGLFDLAAAGASPKRQKLFNTIVLHEDTFQDALMVMKCIKRHSSLSESQIYNRYLNLRGAKLGYLNSLNPTQRAILRFCCHLRFHDDKQAQYVLEAWKGLDESVQKNLEEEMAITGTEGTCAILIYYAPGIMEAFYNRAKNNPEEYSKFIQMAMEALNIIYVEARKRIKEKRNGVFTVKAESVNNYVKEAKVTDEDIKTAKIFVVPYGKHGITVVQ